MVAAFVTYFLLKKEDADWVVVETEHFVVRAKSLEVAEANADALENYALPYLAWFFSNPIEDMNVEKFKIDILADQNAQRKYNPSAYGSYGPNERKITYGFIAINFPQTIFHEFAHMYLHQVVYRGDTDSYLKIPSWLDEGFATYVESLAAFYTADLPLKLDVSNTAFGLPTYRLTEVAQDYEKQQLWTVDDITQYADRKNLDNHTLGYAWSLVAYCIVTGKAAEVEQMLKAYQSPAEDGAPSVNLEMYEDDWRIWLEELLAPEEQ